ncbi:MAG TPA: MarR family winged helix-turn-helix transcriptional regulator [Acidimicrobiales bacterium]|jgi:DNA-binding MarR family transcriptional regulator
MHQKPGPGQLPQEAVVDAFVTASRVLVAMAARSLADAGEEVTLTQYRSLVVLASRGPQGVASLAEAVAVTPPTASRLVDRLVRKGLVVRRTDRHDRRHVRIALTEVGRQLIDVVTEHRRSEIAALLQTIPVKEQRSMVEGLVKLAAAAGEVPEQDWSSGWDL